MMPGKSSAPALSRLTRLSRSSCLTDFDLYPLARSSPTVPGLVTRSLCREAGGLSIARRGQVLHYYIWLVWVVVVEPQSLKCRNARPDPQLRRQAVAQEEDVEVYEEELVPRDRGLEGVARVGELGAEHARDGRLGQAH